MSFNPYGNQQGQDDYYNNSLSGFWPGAGQDPNLDYGGPAANPDLPDPTYGQQDQQQQDIPWYNQPTGGYYTDEFGQQQPNTPISYLSGRGADNFGGNFFNGQQTDIQTVGDANPYGGPAGKFGAINDQATINTPSFQADNTGLPNQTTINTPSFQLDQTGLTLPPGTTPNPQPPNNNGQTLPPGTTPNPQPSPNGVQPPPPPASSSPYPGANGTNSNYQFQQGVDYSKPGAINYTDFQGNAYAKANANRLPAELDPNTSLAGGIDQNKYAMLKSQYGYQMAQNGIADYNQAEQMLYAAGRQDPNSDYYLVDTAGGGYAILKRARTAQGQVDAGFTPPSMRPPASSGGGSSRPGFNYGARITGGGSKGVQAPPSPESFKGIPQGYPAQGSGAYGMAGMLGATHRDPNTGQVSPNYPNTAVEGATRQNLQTGMTEVYHNGQWVAKPQGGGGAGGAHPTPMTR